MANILIVEGVDRVGKTTLVKALEEQCGYKMLKPIGVDLSHRQDTSVDTQTIETNKLWATLSVLVLLEHDKIVIDRFHLSEYVYGKLDRGYINEDCWRIDQILAHLDTQLIYVHPQDMDFSNTKHGSPLDLHVTEFERALIRTSMDIVHTSFYELHNTINYIKGGQ